jgi:NAD(P)-dependent dehydrogenase (short-subunit alcohol dehydrogenase family)
MKDLANRTALITGASRGIGQATAVAMAAAGARVIVHYGRGAEEAKVLLGQIRSAGGVRRNPYRRTSLYPMGRTHWPERSARSSASGSMSWLLTLAFPTAPRSRTRRWRTLTSCSL